MAASEEVQLLNRRIETLERSLKSDQRSSKESKKTFCSKFAEEVELVGLSEALKSTSTAAKLFWLFIFVCCLAGAVYFIFLVIHEYHSEPTATKVQLEKKSIQGEWVYKFPPLLLCVDTWLHVDRAMNLGLTEESIRYALSFLFQPNEFWDARNPTNETSPSAKEEFDNAYRMGNFTNLTEFFEYIALNATVTDRSTPNQDDIQIACNRRCIVNQLPKIITERGICYRIEFGLLRDKDRNRMKSAFLFTIKVPDLSGEFAKRADYWKMFISPQIQHVVSDTAFVSIRKGYTHSIRFSTEHYITLDKADLHCNQSENYSVKKCIHQCDRQYAPPCYKCVSLIYEPQSVIPINEYCNNYYFQNMTILIRDCIDHVLSPYVKCCSKCISDCEYWNYKTEVDVHLSSKLKLEKSKKNNRTISSAKIYFVNSDALAGGVLTYREVSTYSLQSLIGNIGGTLGIWIGASVYTLIKIFAFCSKLCFSQGKKKMDHFERRLSRAPATIHNGVNRDTVA